MSDTKDRYELVELIYRKSPLSSARAGKLADELIAEGYCKQSENAIEVVRCKDCEYWNPMDNGISWHNKGRTDGECDMLHRVHYAERHLTEQDHFCSYGKMKGGAE